MIQKIFISEAQPPESFIRSTTEGKPARTKKSGKDYAEKEGETKEDSDDNWSSSEDEEWEDDDETSGDSEIDDGDENDDFQPSTSK